MSLTSTLPFRPGKIPVCLYIPLLDNHLAQGRPRRDDSLGFRRRIHVRSPTWELRRRERPLGDVLMYLLWRQGRLGPAAIGERFGVKGSASLADLPPGRAAPANPPPPRPPTQEPLPVALAKSAESVFPRPCLPHENRPLPGCCLETPAKATRWPRADFSCRGGGSLRILSRPE
jgi:hypothetical protein